MRSGKRRGLRGNPYMKETTARRRGFSLLELLAVMSIMALLTTLAVTSYFSAITGMARRSAVKHVVNTLILARQRACMEGARVSVMFFDEFHGYAKDEAGKQTSEEICLPSYVVCKELGRLSYVSGGQFGDEFAELDKIFTKKTSDMSTSYSQMRLYNLTRGGWSDVKPWVEDVEIDCVFPYGETVLGQNPPLLTGFVFEKANTDSGVEWKAGDSYGIEVSPIGSLPKGFVFDGLTDRNSEPISISFLPDGIRDTSTGGKGEVKIIETRLPTARPSSRITVSDKGAIEYEDTWK